MEDLIMSTYHYYKEGYAVPYDAFGNVLLTRHLDVPALIAETDRSSLAISDERTLLPSTGFAAADILQLWRVPAGVLLLGGAMRVTTAGSNSDLDIGHASATATMVTTAEHDRWATAIDISGTGYFNFDAENGDEWVAYNGNYGIQTLSIANLSIDLTFNTLAESTLIADFWMRGVKVY